MKVLWFSNCILTTVSSSNSGTWLQTMCQALVDSGVQLFNITQGNTSTIQTIEDGYIKQWILPNITSKQIRSHSLHNSIKEIVHSVNPDIIHIWGMELYWGMLSVYGCFDGYKTLLEIQGIKGACADVFMGGMSRAEVRSTIGLRELLFPSHSLYGFQKNHKKWFPYEKMMLHKHIYISTQSDWVRSWITPYVSDGAKIFETDISVRKEFFEASKWKFHDRTVKQILCFADDGKPYKGLDIAIKALHIVKRVKPNVILNVVGNFKFNRNGIQISGYCKYILKLIKTYGLENNINFIGCLNATVLAEQMASSDVILHPSFVESYSLALAESMTIGVPSVVSFAGAMPELVHDGESALLYNSYDYRKCAYSVINILDNETLSNHLSTNSRTVALKRNNPQRVVNIQLDIYNKILNNA